MDRKADFRIGRQTFFNCIVCFMAIIFLFSSLLIYSYHTERKLEQDTAAQSIRLLSVQLANNITSTLGKIEQMALSAPDVSSRYAELLYRIGNQPENSRTAWYHQELTAQAEEHLSSRPFISFVLVTDRKGNIVAQKAKRGQDSGKMSLLASEIMTECHDKIWYPGGRAVWRTCSENSLFLMRSVFDSVHMSFAGVALTAIDANMIRGVLLTAKGSMEGDFALLDSKGQLICSTGDSGALLTEETSVRVKEGYYSAAYTLEDSGLRLVYYADVQLQNRRFQKILYRCLLLALVSVVFVCFFFGITYFRTARSSAFILKRIDQIANGEFRQKKEIILPDRDMDRILQCLEEMASKIDSLVESVHAKEGELYESEKMLMQTRYDLLRSQVNPHFLYNALETINSMAILRDEKEIGDMVCRLGAYFRVSLMAQSKFWTIREELDMLENYIRLYQAIYQDRLDADYQVDESCREISVPSLLCLPIVENALVHGMECKVEKCHVVLQVVRDGEFVRISIRDDGKGISAEKLKQLMEREASPSGRVGLLNVRKRLKLVYGERASLRIDSEVEKFTRVTIEFPADG